MDEDHVSCQVSKRREEKEIKKPIATFKEEANEWK